MTKEKAKDLAVYLERAFRTAAHLAENYDSMGRNEIEAKLEELNSAMDDMFPKNLR